MKELTLPATLENLGPVQEFVEQELKASGFSEKVMMQVSVAVEEIYVNIAHYAYDSEVGEATVRCMVGGEPTQVTVQFLDGGKPFNPLEKPDADITLSASDRRIGGLGILMVKRSMDEVEYVYEGGKNVLTLKKTL